MNMSWPPNTSNWTPLFCPFIASCVTGSWCMTASARWLLDLHDLHHRCQDLSGNTKRRALRFTPSSQSTCEDQRLRSGPDGLIVSSPARLEHMHAISRCLKIKSSCKTTSFPNEPEWLETYRRFFSKRWDVTLPITYQVRKLHAITSEKHCMNSPCKDLLTFLPPTLECCIVHGHCLRKQQHFHPVGESQYETLQQKLVCRIFLHPKACLLEAVSCGGKPPLWRSIVWPPHVDLGVSDLPLLHQVLQSTVWVAHAETWTYDIPSSDGMLQCPWRLEPQQHGHQFEETLCDLDLQKPGCVIFLPTKVECCTVQKHYLHKPQHFHPIGEARYETLQQRLACRTLLHPKVGSCIVQNHFVHKQQHSHHLAEALSDTSLQTPGYTQFQAPKSKVESYIVHSQNFRKQLPSRRFEVVPYASVCPVPL